MKDLDTQRNIILKYVLEDITLVSVGYTYLTQNRGTVVGSGEQSNKRLD